MSAAHSYISSALLAFSTYVGGVNAAEADKRAATQLFQTLLTWKTDYSVWEPQEVDQYIAETGFSTQNSEATKLLKDFIQRFPPFQVSVYLQRYLLALTEDGCSPATIRNYRSDINQFWQFAKKTELEQIFTKPVVKNFVRYEKQKGLKVSSIRRKLASISQFGLWASRQGLLTGVSWLNDPNLLEKFEEDLVISGQGLIIPLVKPPIISPQPAEAKPTQPPLLQVPSREAARPTARRLQEHRAQIKAQMDLLTSRVKTQTRTLVAPYVTLAMVILFFLGIGIFGYQQFIVNTLSPLAYPSTPTPPNRVLSFQGRLTDTAQNPITAPTDMEFWLYDSGPSIVGGTILWNSGTCSVTPDQDGIFTVGLGDDCGSAITEDVFSENVNVWLQVGVEGETLSPRQPIRTVPYALNSETLQGYPIDASGAATVNTVLTMDGGGSVVLGEVNPEIRSVSGTFAIQGQTLLFQTNSGSNGNIIFDADGIGGVISRDYIYAPGATLSATYAGGTSLVLRGGPSGTANIQEWQNAAGSALASVTSAGRFLGDSFNASNTASGYALSGSQTLTSSGTTYILGAHGSWTDVNIRTGGSNRLSINSSGVVTIPNLNTAGGIIYAQSGGALGVSAAGNSGECLLSGGTGAPTFGSCADAVADQILWQQVLGTAQLKNTTLDMLVGGTSSTSAKFAVLNVNSGTPVASISANSGNIATYLTGNGTLGTTNRQTLTIGNSSAYNTTGNVLINSNQVGRVGIGTTAPAMPFHVFSNSASSSNLAMFEYQSNGTGLDASIVYRNYATPGQNSGPAFNFERADGSAGTPLPVSINRGIGQINFRGYDGSSYLNTAGVSAAVDGTAGSNDMPGRLMFSTTPDGSSTLAERMRIDNTGNVGISTTAPSGKLHVLNTTGQTGYSIFGNPWSVGGTNYANPWTLSTSARFGLISSGNYGSSTFPLNSNFLGSAYANAGLVGLSYESSGGSGAYVHGVVGLATTNQLTGGTGRVAGGYFIASTSATTGSSSPANDNYYGVYTEADTRVAAASAGTLYGIYARGLGKTGDTVYGGYFSGTGGTTNYGVYSNAGINYFSGSVGIGNTSPSSRLDVFSSAVNTDVQRWMASDGSRLGRFTETSGGAGWFEVDNASGVAQWLLRADGGASYLASGNFGIGTTSPVAPLHVNQGYGANAAAIINQLNSGDILTASASGTTRLNLANNGQLTLSAYTTNGGIFYANGSGLLAQTTAGSLGECLVSNGGGAPTWGTCGSGGNSYWRENLGALSPINDTYDILFGADATDSAKFVFLNMTAARGNQVASVSGHLVLDAAGTIQTTNNQTMTIGGNSTGDIAFAPGNTTDTLFLRSDGNVGVGTSTPQALFSVGSGSNFQVGSTGDVLINNTAPTIQFNDTSGGEDDFLMFADAGLFSFQNVSTGQNGFTFASYGITLGDNTDTKTLNIGGVSNSAADTINISTNGTLADAIAIGNNNAATTLDLVGGDDWSIDGTGQITSALLNTPGGVLYAGTGGTVNVSAAGSVGECLLSGGTASPTWSACPNQNYWRINQGALSPVNDTLDLLVGSNATASAKFGVLNVNGTGPATATVSGNLIVMPLNGAGGRVGVGTTTPDKKITISTATNLKLGLDDRGIYYSRTSDGGYTASITSDGYTGTGTPSLTMYAYQNLLFTNNSNGSGTAQGLGVFRDNTSGFAKVLVGSGSITTGASSLLSVNGNAAIGNSYIGTNAPTNGLIVQGNVGIGTATPGNKLTVDTSTGNDGIYLNNAGSLRAILDIGGGTAGRLTLYNNGVTQAVRLQGNGDNWINGGNLGIGTASPVAPLHLNRGYGANAAAIINQLNSGDILAASASGTTRMRLSNAGGLYLSALNTAGGIVYTDANGQLLTSAAGLSGECLLSGGSGAPTFGSCAAAVADQILWQQVLGTAQLKNTTLDMLVGGTSSASAKFAVLNVNSGTPTASISGSTTGAAVYITGDGTIARTLNQDLYLNPTAGRVGIGTTSPTTTLQVNGNVQIRANSGIMFSLSDTSGNVGWRAEGTNRLGVVNAVTGFIERGDIGSSIRVRTRGGNALAQTSGTEVLFAVGNTFNPTSGTAVYNNALFDPTINQTGGANGITRGIYINPTLTAAADWRSLELANTSGYGIYQGGIGAINYLNGRLGLGTANPVAPLHVDAGYGANAATIINQLNTGDILVASASGTTRLQLANSGTLTLSAYTNNGGVLYTNGSGTIAQTVTGAAGECLHGGATPTWATCEGLGSNWRITNGAISPDNDTLDLLVGSNATVSAKFAFINVDSGTPTASISANTTDNNTYLSGDGILGTTNRQTLALGGTDTGDITLNPGGVASVSLHQNNTLTLAGYTTAGGVLYTNGSGLLSQTSAGTAGQCLQGGASPTWSSCEGLGSNWRISNGAISPDNDTLDLLIGSNATASAKFAVLNVNGTGPATATVSGNLTVMPRNGAGGYVGIGTIAPTSNLDVRQLADGIDTVSIRRFTNSSPTGTLLRFNDASGSLLTFFGTFGEYHGQAITEAFDSYFDGGNWYFRGSGSAPTRIGSNNNTNIELYPQGTGNVSVRSGQLLLGNGSSSAPAMSFMSDTNTGIFGTGSDVLGFSTNGAERMRINNIGRIGIGTTTIVGGVNIDLNSGMNAGLIVNELGGGDLLTASASGTTRFRVDTNGYVHAQRFSDLADPTFFLDSAATGDSLSIAGDIRLGGGGVQNIYTTTDVGINIDPTNGTGCTTTCPVSIANGVGKIDAGAFDPPYWIQGVGYSTYAPSMVGIKEELSQVVTLQPSSVPGLYKYVIDFPSLNRTRDLDLWLFSQVSDFGPEMRDLAVLLSATGDARVNYKKDPATKQLIIYSDKPVEVSMRLTSPRFDYDKWGTIRDLQDGKGLRPTGQNFAVTGAGSSDQDLANALAQAQTWTVSSLGSLNINGSEPGSISVTKADGSSIQTAQAYLAAVIGQIRAGFIQTQQLVADRVTTNRLRSNQGVETPRVETDLISPIAGDDLTIGLKSGSDSQLRVVNQQQQVVATVDATGNAAFAGNVRAASISANRADITSARLQTIESRMAELEHVRAQTADIVNATISGTLYADDIYAFQDKVAAALEQPSLLSQLLGQIPTSSSSASPSDIFQVIDVDPTIASGAGSLNKTLADLNLSSDDVVLGGSAAFINQYFEVNGSGYIAQSLGIGDSLLVGSGTRLADSELEYISPTNPESSVLKLQPSGLGTIDFLAGAMTITQDGRVTINGNLKVAGQIETPTLLTDIIKSTDFANPLQVQVAGVSTESGEVHKSRFEIINELGTPVATISADGRADFAAGIGVGSQDLGESQDAETNKTSGRATITAETFDVTIRTRQIGPNSLVYVTPVGSTGNQVLYVKSQTADNPETGDNEGRFVVGFDEATTQNVQFNWWIVN